MAVLSFGQNALAPEKADGGLVQTALANEWRAVQDEDHPMRYLLHKSSPRLSTTKELVETRDGSVAALVSVDDRPLSTAESQKDRERLDSLLTNPGKQKHRKQSQDEDSARASKVLRSLPDAFLYEPAGTVAYGSGTADKFTFTPNPKFNPPDLETHVLTAMTGYILVDPAHARVLRLEAHLQQDVDFGWGILGQLYKGGWITIDQEDVGGGVWRVVKFQMKMSARVLVKSRTFDTIEVESHFTPVPVGLTYRQGIEMLREGAHASR